LKRIGMDKKVEIDWLDRLAFGLKEKKSYKELRIDLENLLQNSINGDESRRKHINVLMRIWVSVSPEHEEIRNRALDLLSLINNSERTALHWGLSLLAYDLFRDVTSIIGRLLTLDEDISLAQVHNRIVENWGDRTNLKFALQRMFRTMVNWGVLMNSKKPGIYKQSKKICIYDKELNLWLAECYLTCIEKRSISLENLIEAHALFPFVLVLNLGDLIDSGRFEVNRQGLDVDVVELR